MNQTNRVAGISQKYDASLDYGIDMYDNLPYERNADVCNSSTIALYSGHIIKYYLCINQEESFPVNNHDDEIHDILRRIQAQETQRLSEEAARQEVLDVPTSDLTDEQLQALTADQGASAEADTAEESGFTPEQVINLDDIEDW